MYVPRPFAPDPGEIRALLGSLRAGHLVTSTQEGLLATFMPFIYEPEVGEHGALLGHVARPNLQWQRAALGEAVVIVQGPDGYISPSWYVSKREHARVVPTWDYVVLQVFGELRIHDDVQFVRNVVERLTERFESGSAEPWQVSDAPADYIERQLRAIVGIELIVTRVEASAKLSQNRPADIDGVIEGLRERGDVSLADEVEKHRPR